MTRSKRLFDIIAAAFLLAILMLPIAIIMIVILVFNGRPIFFISERSKSTRENFRLIKFRTMRPDVEDFGASGGHKSHRITSIGHFLRRTRLDELPQLINVLKGDMSFVGPRPPLPLYVNLYPELYGKVLKSRPGITGMASIYFHKHEDWLLRNAKSSVETEAIYRRICVPRKAKLDLIYQKKRTLCFDLYLLLRTVIKTI